MNELYPSDDRVFKVSINMNVSRDIDVILTLGKRAIFMVMSVQPFYLLTINYYHEVPKKRLENHGKHLTNYAFTMVNYVLP